MAIHSSYLGLLSPFLSHAYCLKCVTGFFPSIRPGSIHPMLVALTIIIVYDFICIYMLSCSISFHLLCTVVCNSIITAARSVEPLLHASDTVSPVTHPCDVQCLLCFRYHHVSRGYNCSVCILGFSTIVRCLLLEQLSCCLSVVTTQTRTNS